MSKTIGYFNIQWNPRESKTVIPSMLQSPCAAYTLDYPGMATFRTDVFNHEFMPMTMTERTRRLTKGKGIHGMLKERQKKRGGATIDQRGKAAEYRAKYNFRDTPGHSDYQDYGQRMNKIIHDNTDSRSQFSHAPGVQEAITFLEGPQGYRYIDKTDRFNYRMHDSANHLKWEGD